MKYQADKTILSMFSTVEEGLEFQEPKQNIRVNDTL